LKAFLLNAFFILLFAANSFGQTFIFFSDSPNSQYYDPSWGFTNGSSALEMVNSSKFPVETSNFYTGANSLRLKWTSKSGGDWGIAVAEDGWPGHDITAKDSLVMWIFSQNDVQSSLLPVIYLEDLKNTKSPKQQLGNYSGNIKGGAWNRVSVPLKPFIQSPGSTDMTKIKTIYFGQNAADGAQHTLLLDDIRMITKSAVVPPTPQNVTAKGYQRHIDIFWDLLTDNTVDGYKIYRLENSVYKAIGSVSKNDHIFTDFCDSIGAAFTYKVAAFNSGLVESLPSDLATASTRQMSDDELLTMAQEASFRYFWDYAHPVSGLARERYNSGNTVTTGGSGFGIGALITGVERGFITRGQGVERMLKILNFLSVKADRFHGAFPHWLDGETGKVQPFSAYDNGGDLVETAFLIEGLLTARQYFNKNDADETSIRSMITAIWESVEWNWYRQSAESLVLFWHWSPNYLWKINMPVKGWDEALIIYLLAVASPTHSVSPLFYSGGWASTNYTNGRSFYGIPLYVGANYGGPLFFAHYSFIGFDPRNKKDAYANYFDQNKNHSLINRAYCMANPGGYKGYSGSCWGLTASDDPTGYLAHEPTNDNGTISPTAALSSMPYTPNESMSALKEFYNVYGKKIWGIYGFKDAFNVSRNWYADSYIAIDQGPVVCMIENYRSQVLWNNFMANPEIQPMLDKLGFKPDFTDVVEKSDKPSSYELKNNYPNPFNPVTTIAYSVPKEGKVSLKVYNLLGKEVARLVDEVKPAGSYNVLFDASKLASGVYFYKIEASGFRSVKKMTLIK
jgi:hypothetical protein